MKKAAKSRKPKIKGAEFAVMTVTVRGLTPLIVHRFDRERFMKPIVCIIKR